jgi:hypothetical protein
MVFFFSFFKFHTYDYARHFVSACCRILGLEGTPESVEDQGRLTTVTAVNIKPMFLLPTLYMFFKCFFIIFCTHDSLSTVFIF